ncbi:MAG: hypothetical protein AVDCRST_MAG73-2424, partial [uncultured Thermomicrobiales bacterium]
DPTRPSRRSPGDDHDHRRPARRAIGMPVRDAPPRSLPTTAPAKSDLRFRDGL